jgi:hypothetical protein
MTLLKIFVATQNGCFMQHLLKTQWDIEMRMSQHGKVAVETRKTNVAAWKSSSGNTENKCCNTINTIVKHLKLLQHRTTLVETSQSICATLNGARWNISTCFMQHQNTKIQNRATGTTAEDNVTSVTGKTAAHTTTDSDCSPPPSGNGGAHPQEWEAVHAAGLPFDCRDRRRVRRG